MRRDWSRRFPLFLLLSLLSLLETCRVTLADTEVLEELVFLDMMKGFRLDFIWRTS